MANTNQTRGFVPARYLNGTAWNGQFNIYYHPASDATTIGVGDPVTMLQGGGADATGRFPSVIRAAAATTIVGVAIGFGTVPTGIQGVDPAVLFDPSNLTLAYGPASTAYYVAVVDDPFVIFEIQEDSDTVNIGITDLMGTVEHVAADCNTSTGISGYKLDSSTATGLIDYYTWRLLRLVDRSDNEIGQYARWFVMCNRHHFLSGVAVAPSSSASASVSPSASPSG